MKCLFFFLSSFSVFILYSQPIPTKKQVDWQQLETNAFIHFTVNTFTGKEWGDGSEDPSIFNPVNFNAREIIRTLKNAGFKMAIITAKHHDGFCLWPSNFTNHSIKFSPYKNGKGDIVKEISNACREFGLKFGFYLSPWDRHEPTYGTPAYNEYYKSELKELLTNYGEISEVWFDGAKGANAKNMNYDFEGYWKLVHELQPGALIFSDAGPDIRWVGNESGNAGETCWSSINNEHLEPGKADPSYLNHGDENGKYWIPAETDVSIRPGWFYHSSEDSVVKTGKQLLDIYFQSVGRNSLLLLNIPPDKKGTFNRKDVRSIMDFHKKLLSVFKTNLLKPYISKNLTDRKLQTFISIKKGEPLVINFNKLIRFNILSIQENITNGQHIESALVEYRDGNSWKQLVHFTTVGYKRILKFEKINTKQIRLTLLSSKGTVELAELGAYEN